MSVFLNDVWDGPTPSVVNDSIDSEHFNKVAEAVTNVKLLESLKFEAWIGISNKMIYRSFAVCFTRTKVEREALVDMSSVWLRLGFLGYDRAVHEVSYLMVHNKLPVQERLFRIQLSRDPYCVACPTASIQDVSHYFMKCGRTNYYWNWTKELS